MAREFWIFITTHSEEDREQEKAGNRGWGCMRKDIGSGTLKRDFHHVRILSTVGLVIHSNKVIIILLSFGDTFSCLIIVTSLLPKPLFHVRL